MTDSFRHRPAVRLFLLMLPIVCTLAVGAFSARMQSDALRLWYPTLEKSSLTPPNAVFPLVWTLLYILTGLSMGMVLLADDRRKYKVLLLFAFKLGLNYLCCYLFFICQSCYIACSWPVRKIAALLFIPYIAWIGFALYLNLYIWLYN